MKDQEHKRIVIAGGGFAGVRAAKMLSKSLPNSSITLINDTPYHSFHADLYGIATAVLLQEQRIDFENLYGSVNIPLTKILRDTGVMLIIDSISEIDFYAKTVQTKNGHVESYDWLVLALGSAPNFFDIQGAERHAYCLRTADDAINIRNAIEEHVSNGAEEKTFVVAGGSFSGIELACQLAYFVCQIAKKYGKKQPHVVLLEASPQLLPGLGPWVQRKALERLEQLGITVLTNHSIDNIEETQLWCKNGISLQYNLLVWAAGFKGVSVQYLGHNVPLNDKNRFVVQPDLSINDYPEVFIAGDLVHFQDEKHGHPVPNTARNAIDQATLVASNIVHQAIGIPTTSYIAPAPVYVMAAGGRNALAHVGPISLSGFVAWFFKRIISLKYFLSILPIFEALRLWGKGVNTYIRSTNYEIDATNKP